MLRRLRTGWLIVMAVAALHPTRAAGGESPYHSPYDLAFSPDGRKLAVSDRTAGCVVLIDVALPKPARQIPTQGHPAGVLWSGDSTFVWVAEYDSGTVAGIEAQTGTLVHRYPVGPRPLALMEVATPHELWVTLSARSEVAVLELPGGQVRTRIRTSRHPFHLAMGPDQSLALASNFLPAGSAAESVVAASVSLIDVRQAARLAEIPLANGATLVRQTAISPDGRWGYAVHDLGRFAVPVTQLDRGWINGNALSVIDLPRRQLYATVLLDQLHEGAPDPWGLQLAPDGKSAWITLSGLPQVVQVDLDQLHRLLAGEVALPHPVPARLALWDEIRRDPANRSRLVNHLEALYGAGLIRRFALPGQGLRAVRLSPDHSVLAVAAYYSGEVLLVNPTTGKTTSRIALGPGRKPDPIRLGEMVFHDATRSFQSWLSCSTCHPEGRMDGLNWDLTNDSIGTPNNTRSLLWSHRTPPVMARGVRSDMESAALAGFRFTLNYEPTAQEIEAVRAYLRSLEPEPSPWRPPNGELSDRAKQGQAVFESPQTRCAVCHPPPLYTDLTLRNIGTGLPPDTEVKIDTPVLIELWRTAPYLHHGGAVTLREVFTKFNPADRHGRTSHLSDADLEALEEYLLSL